jgi:hypothetical protein
MSRWTEDELRRIEGADELEMAPVRRNGQLRSATPIWAVRVGDDIYVRAAYGSGSGWYGVARTSRRAHIAAGGVERDVAVEDAEASVIDQVDRAYRSKYGGRYASIVDQLVQPDHRVNTVRLVPREAGR